MESLKLRFFAVVLVAVVAMASVQMTAAADAPAPSPTSDATVFTPTIFASFTVLLLGYFFC